VLTKADAVCARVIERVRMGQLVGGGRQGQIVDSKVGGRNGEGVVKERKEQSGKARRGASGQKLGDWHTC
jgi:hypothetical protein